VLAVQKLAVDGLFMALMLTAGGPPQIQGEGLKFLLGLRNLFVNHAFLLLPNKLTITLFGSILLC
jgi:hypothetical protein